MRELVAGRRKKKGAPRSFSEIASAVGSDLLKRAEGALEQSRRLQIPVDEDSKAGRATPDAIANLLRANEAHRYSISAHADLGLFVLIMRYSAEHRELHSEADSKSRADYQRIYGEVVNQYFAIRKEIRNRDNRRADHDPSIA